MADEQTQTGMSSNASSQAGGVASAGQSQSQGQGVPKKEQSVEDLINMWTDDDPLGVANIPVKPAQIERVEPLLSAKPAADSLVASPPAQPLQGGAHASTSSQPQASTFSIGPTASVSQPGPVLQPGSPAPLQGPLPSPQIPSMAPPRPSPAGQFPQTTAPRPPSPALSPAPSNLAPHPTVPLTPPVQQPAQQPAITTPRPGPPQVKTATPISAPAPTSAPVLAPPQAKTSNPISIPVLSPTPGPALTPAPGPSVPGGQFQSSVQPRPSSPLAPPPRPLAPPSPSSSASTPPLPLSPRPPSLQQTPPTAPKVSPPSPQIPSMAPPRPSPAGQFSQTTAPRPPSPLPPRQGPAAPPFPAPTPTPTPAPAPAPAPTPSRPPPLSPPPRPVPIKKTPEKPIEAEIVEDDAESSQEVADLLSTIKKPEKPIDDEPDGGFTEQLKELFQELHISPGKIIRWIGCLLLIVGLIYGGIWSWKNYGPIIIEKLGGDAPQEDGDTIQQPPQDGTKSTIESGITESVDVGKGTATEPIIIRDTGIETGVMIGEEKPQIKQFALYITQFKLMENAYKLDVNAFLNQSTNRRARLKSHILLMNQLYKEGNMTLGEIQAERDGLNRELVTHDKTQDQLENAFFDEINALNGIVAEDLLEQFIHEARAAVTLRARYRAVQRLETLFSNALPRFERRIRDLELNQEALISGVKIYDVTGSDLELIVPVQENSSPVPRPTSGSTGINSSGNIPLIAPQQYKDVSGNDYITQPGG